MALDVFVKAGAGTISQLRNLSIDRSLIGNYFDKWFIIFIYFSKKMPNQFPGNSLSNMIAN